jgi:beta-glucanase (GH16 family)
MGSRSLAVVAVLILLAAGLGLATAGHVPIAPTAIAPVPSAISTRLGASPEPGSTPSPYTFDDEFDGTTLGPAWDRHFSCCGNLAGLDSTLATVSNGFLSLAVDHRADGWYADLIDTKASFTQLYGTFEARIRIPKGQGLWPAFWSYFSGDGTNAEIDTMEVCGGARDGPPASVLHTTVFWSPREKQTRLTPTVDLSQDFHVYAVDWRPDHVTFSLDGTPVWTFTDANHIPQVPLPLILDLGVGGDFCGEPDATTPNQAEMLVDWVHALP